jgi:hypothetical protein
MKDELENNIEIYSRQFELSDELIGKTISKIVFYLEESDKEFTEQPNKFGKSLLQGIDIRTIENQTYSIGNRFTNLGYGLRIDRERTDKIEYFQEERTPIQYESKITGERINQVRIYWMKFPYESENGLYPQEIEILTENRFLLLSSIEVNNGEINTEFTNELLLVEEEDNARELNLGNFGLITNGRFFFNDVNKLIEKLKTGYNNV